MNTTEQISNALKLCNENYDEKTLKHAIRVANLAMQNILSDGSNKTQIFIFGLLHDIIEDTNVTYKEISEKCDISNSHVEAVLSALTKQKDETYIEYIQRLKASNEEIAYIIKLADMKDHLSQKETLTDKLKDKYWEALPYLL